MASVIEVAGLRKTFASRLGKARITALDGIDFSVQPGELFGLLGPNGAGKTTTVKILLGLTRATEGSARVCGCAWRYSLHRLGRWPISWAMTPTSSSSWSACSSKKRLPT